MASVDEAVSQRDRAVSSEHLSGMWQAAARSRTTSRWTESGGGASARAAGGDRSLAVCRTVLELRDADQGHVLRGVGANADRSKLGADVSAIFTSLLTTARKHGENLFQALRSITGPSPLHVAGIPCCAGVARLRSEKKPSAQVEGL